MNSCLPFAVNSLLKHVRRGVPVNAAVSPLSLSASVTMLGAGCSGRLLDRVLDFAGSKSLDELKSRFSETMSMANTSRAKGCPEIKFVNGVWIDKRLTFKPSYHKCITDTFKSQAKVHDFQKQGGKAAVVDINAWVNVQTKGLIPSIIDAIRPETAAILGNALYFKGAWLDAFNPKYTRKRDFYLVNGDKIKDVPFMTSNKSYLYGSFKDFKVLEIPYQRRNGDDNAFSMQLILPKEKNGLQKLLEKFDADLGCLNGQFELEKHFIDDLWIPKFKFEFTLENIQFPFMNEGGIINMTDMFVQTEEGPLYPKIFQKVMIEVSEEGTEAAAVTLSTVFGACAPSVKKPPRVRRTFVAEHPFMFIIKEENSGIVIFTGIVLNPQKRAEIK
ncbi:OLC1v1026073C1 [Oldenlandia corymbosa var. corymbosa]|uniref:OLC1v1026073C1 n=1 Tax=Oldenlandia corymbosa var. corymbosa TaxID=529605 RepID=A0AAV1C6B6_OLDCO|nr:OLC1v1026073C1 [Oldenlandia corymbosa var. corymbosa]